MVGKIYLKVSYTGTHVFWEDFRSSDRSDVGLKECCKMLLSLEQLFTLMHQACFALSKVILQPQESFPETRELWRNSMQAHRDQGLKWSPSIRVLSSYSLWITLEMQGLKGWRKFNKRNNTIKLTHTHRTIQTRLAQYRVCCCRWLSCLNVFWQ